jgi:hypothetical protein
MNADWQHGFLVGAGFMFVAMHVCYLAYLAKIGQLPWCRSSGK